MSKKTPSLPVSLAEIRAAAAAIAGEVLRTPAVPAPALSKLTGADIVVKLETLHPTGSFKERGALNKLKSLAPEQRAAGIIAMSAGNHAQGVAYHARRLGIPATIVMPEGTPFTKIERTAAHGARIVLRGAGLSEAHRAAQAIAAEQGLTFVHPYDDPAIIAGQGTIGLELLADFPELDAIVVPVGGGGLISGIAIAAKALNAGVEIVGVEAALYPSMLEALRGKPAPRPAGGQTIAEGIAVKDPGVLTRATVSALVSDILLVDESALERAIETLLDLQKLVVEGAGAAALAAVMAHPERFRGRRVALVLCGGNIDARLLASVLMRGLVRGGRLVRLRAEISDSPGVLAKLTHIIGEKGGNIVEIYHQRLFHDVPVKLAELDVVVETRNPGHVAEIVTALNAGGFPTRLLSNTADEAGAAASRRSDG
ncbi:MAG TPA: threonine ammonia-lyase [Stellaceae bacterium]|nr:threonine ammonia-lyase [Stellaceae bacterium]